MSHRSGLVHTVAAITALILTVAVIAAELTGHSPHHTAGLGSHTCPPGTHYAYVSPAIHNCIHSVWNPHNWHWPHWIWD